MIRYTIHLVRGQNYKCGFKIIANYSYMYTSTYHESQSAQVLVFNMVTFTSFHVRKGHLKNGFTEYN